jgi:hypothetical protein
MGILSEPPRRHPSRSWFRHMSLHRASSLRPNGHSTSMSRATARRSWLAILSVGLAFCSSVSPLACGRVVELSVGRVGDVSSGGQGNGPAGGQGGGQLGGQGGAIPLPECAAEGQDCSAAGDCCSGVCDDAAGTCSASIWNCAAEGQACTSSVDCCSLSCVSGVCRADCNGDGDACSEGGECCSGTCDQGACQPLSDVCTTAGNDCTEGSECCSQLCSEGVCSLGSSFCAQMQDVCAADGDCCSGNCQRSSGQEIGKCGQVPAGASNCTGVAGTVCGDCNECCSRLCAPFGDTGVSICQAAGGCRLTGELCQSDLDCCGGDPKSGLAGARWAAALRAMSATRRTMSVTIARLRTTAATEMLPVNANWTSSAFPDVPPSPNAERWGRPAPRPPIAVMNGRALPTLRGPCAVRRNNVSSWDRPAPSTPTAACRFAALKVWGRPRAFVGRRPGAVQARHASNSGNSVRETGAAGALTARSVAAKLQFVDV